MSYRSSRSCQMLEPLEQRMLLSGTLQRPIEEFVAAQGTYTGGVFGQPPGTIFTPPAKNYIAWTAPAQGLGVSVDYAGLANNNTQGNLGLGTSFSGSVTEVEQNDGSSIVKVVLRTENALTYVISFDAANDPPTAFQTNPLIFGVRIADVVDGATPALGSSVLTLTYASPNFGDPLVDLLALVGDEPPPGTLLSVGFQASASGTFADGSPGMAIVSQRGIFNTNPNHPPGRDFFPVERITLIHTGGGQTASSVGAFSDGEPIGADLDDLMVGAATD